MDSFYALVGLFLTALFAATILPAQSEFVLVGLHLRASFNPVTLVAVATAGNVLGSVINWCIGRFLMRFSERRWFPIRPTMIERATCWYHRWGVWSLLVDCNETSRATYSAMSALPFGIALKRATPEPY